MLVITSMMLRFTNDVLDSPNLHIQYFPIYMKVGVVISYSNMYKHAKNQAHISKIH